jgi:hypothetical protein
VSELVSVRFKNVPNIVVQRVEVGANWGPKLLGPKYFHVVTEHIQHQMAVMCGFSVLLEFMRHENSYFLVHDINFSYKTSKYPSLETVLPFLKK